MSSLDACIHLFRKSLVGAGLILLVTACGGGGGDGEDNGVSTPEGPPPSSIPGPRPKSGPRDFVTFESGQVRPLALADDGSRLFAVNTPDNRLAIFTVDVAGLTLESSVPVGMEPVAVAEDGNGMLWVVNHLSDSVSIIDVSLNPPRVVRTLLVGDEPRDIVFGGANKKRAFITTAHRGQNSPVDPQLTTGGVGRADVWVFDADNLGASLGGDPLTIITLFGDTPRALAVTPDGSTVYAAIFASGNRTTVLPPNNFNKVPPLDSADDVDQPNTGVIVRFNGANWVDESNQIFNNFVGFSLPDLDVFEIDALANPPIETDSFSGVGTMLFNMTVNPSTGTLYVSNTDARNMVRFSGLAQRASSTVRGHLADNRITVIKNGTVQPRFLNKHLDFNKPFGSLSDRNTSLSLPLDMAVTSDGSTLYMTAFGSQKIAIFNTSQLEDDTFTPHSNTHIELSGGGPSGVVIDEVHDRLYVLTRFDNGISVVDTNINTETDHILMFNPELEHVTKGRPFLYDARLTSSRGNDSCASCHVFGNTDGLAWDLGDPDGVVKPNPNAFTTISAPVSPNEFHPMKGPMTTQSMRGLKGHGPMHWRGDRTGVNRKDGETLEEAAFKEFNEAFEALMAREGQLTAEEMQTFTDYTMELTYPPNPHRKLDNSLGAVQERGLDLFNSGVVNQSTGFLEVCRLCHPIDPVQGVFGTTGLMSDNIQPGERNFKIPHFRDQYQKIGMFGRAFAASPANKPNQIRGFAFNHNGATSSTFILIELGMPSADLEAMRQFLYAFPTESPPVLGQQITLTDTNAATVESRIDLLIERAFITQPVPECDLVVKGVVGGEQRGWLMDESGMFVSDKTAENPVSDSELRAFANVADQELTFTCAPWGSGRRMGIDSDLDGVLDGDE
ncbi:MAG: YncE family protein [Gammaproteobacteria bacterium]|nr:YncE family protein [Gammaproteobacteria bacterium]